ncbi:glycosyl hydrolase family 28-related protein [Paenibacillus sanguinis]|uniref:glycosyl hydrolase family 28-related protein n=1 Tax=Paenibacillus sanguinis TaxID=225906 RepID=UPI000368F699|nr:glycosyl hydrolase family 28-related protein [Paenibacillus sanguinis]
MSKFTAPRRIFRWVFTLTIGSGLLLLAASLLFGPPVYNVKEAGAKGDGITNDTRIFLRVLEQAAASGRGATIIVPPGTYLLAVNEPLPLASGVTLRGKGQPVLLFRELAGATHGFEGISIHGRGIRMEGVTVDGGNRLNRGVGIHAGSSDVQITNSHIRQLSQPANSLDPLHSTVVAGVMIYGNTSDIVIQNCEVTRIAARSGTPVARGIMVWNEPGQTIARRVHILNNQITHITPKEDADAIFFDKPPASSPLSRSVIAGNVIYHAAKRGIKIATPGVEVRGNRIHNMYQGNNRYVTSQKEPLPQDMYAAISIYADAVTVTDNLITGTGSYYNAIEADIGVSSGYLRSVVITDNTIYRGESPRPVHNTSGIWLGAVREFRVTGNRISGTEIAVRLSEEARTAIRTGGGYLSQP